MITWKKWEILIIIAVVALLPTYWIGSEVYYACQISPHGIATVSDFFKQFGEPKSIYTVKQGEKYYYEFVGFLPPPKLLGALPSGPPAYVFDQQGHFVNWCSDIGDNDVFHQQWPLNSTNKLELRTVKQKLGLQ